MQIPAALCWCAESSQASRCVWKSPMYVSLSCTPPESIPLLPHHICSFTNQNPSLPNSEQIRRWSKTQFPQTLKFSQHAAGRQVEAVMQCWIGEQKSVESKTLQLKMDQTNSLSLFIPPVNMYATSVLPAFPEETCLISKLSLQEVRPGVYVLEMDHLSS